jgi:hypothetical protein
MKPRLAISTRAPVVLVGAAALLLALVVGVGVAVDTLDPQRQVKVSKEEALATVLALAPEAAGASVDGPQEGAYYRFYEVQGADILAAVDANDGRIISLTLVKLTPSSSKVVLTTADAERAAAAYLAAHSIPTAGLTESAELRDHGDYVEFEVTWQGYIGEVLVPDARSVLVDPSDGTVFGFSDFRHPYATPPSPQVSREEALQSAALASEMKTSVVDKVQLRVDFDQSGTQLLEWEIALSADSGQGWVDHTLVHVDAMTGVTTVVGRG